MFKKLSITAFVCAALLFSTTSFAGNERGLTDDKNRASLFNNSVFSPVVHQVSDSIYNMIGLAMYGLDREIFFKAYKGYQFLMNKGELRKTHMLTICDYSQSINNKRLYVIDLKNNRLMYNTYVSHGKNSGDEFATSFSNSENSNKSSLGFMVTGNTYRGIAGYSMKFIGMERGFNTNVTERSIVLHGSLFVNEHTMQQRGLMGKSYGCPAVPMAIHKQIIDAIKGGSCFFVYHPDEWYARSSAILNAPFDLAPVGPAQNIASQQAAPLDVFLSAMK